MPSASELLKGKVEIYLGEGFEKGHLTMAGVTYANNEYPWRMSDVLLKVPCKTMPDDMSLYVHAGTKELMAVPNYMITPVTEAPQSLQETFKGQSLRLTDEGLDYVRMLEWELDEFTEVTYLGKGFGSESDAYRVEAGISSFNIYLYPSMVKFKDVIEESEIFEIPEKAFIEEFEIFEIPEKAFKEEKLRLTDEGLDYTKWMKLPLDEFTVFILHEKGIGGSMNFYRGYFDENTYSQVYLYPSMVEPIPEQEDIN